MAKRPAKEKIIDGSIVRTHKFRMYPSYEQEKKLYIWTKQARKMYNISLEHKKINYLISLYPELAIPYQTITDLYKFRFVTNKDVYPCPENPILVKLESMPKKTKEEKEALKVFYKTEEGKLKYYSSSTNSLGKEFAIFKQEFPEFTFVPDSLITSNVKSIFQQSDQAHSKYISNVRNKKPGEQFYFPDFKSSKDEISLVSCKLNDCSFDILNNNRIVMYGFPKIKEGLKIRLLRPEMEMIDPKNILMQSIVKEADCWYLCVTFKIFPKINHILGEPKIVGVDLGIKRSVQLSDGTFKNYPEEQMKGFLQRKKVLQRRIRKKNGGYNCKKTCKIEHEHRHERQSKKFKKAHKQISKIDKKLAHIRQYHSKQFATEIVKQYDVIVVENLDVSNMTASAKGTTENPGTNVKAKSGLNRSLLNVAMYTFKVNLIKKAEEHGKKVIQVPPHFTSQRCNRCGYKSKKNRKSQSVFRCTNPDLKCDWECNADYNASLNIRDLGMNQKSEEVNFFESFCKK